MSTYTPFFPPTDLISSSLPSTSSPSETHPTSKLSYSARLSRSHLALASVSEYILRPPSPTSDAVDQKRVSYLRNKFRLAVDATYRDTSSGKWGHVSELAKLGSTRGRWQGVCSGNSAPHSPRNPHDGNNQGVPHEGADPYPRPPIPVSDPREIRDRVEKWQANPAHVEDGERPSPLNFPTVKRRRSDVVKAMKHPKLPERANRNDESMFPTCSLPHGSPTPATPPGQEDIRQVSELFLPPSFPPQLRTSTPPPLSTAKSAHPPLTKPPVIPLTECLFPTASLRSPPPFPHSQAINRDLGSEFQLSGNPSPSARKQPLRDIPSPASSSRPLSRRRLQSPSSERSVSPPKSSFKPDSELHGDARRRDLDVSPALNTPGYVPVIDLRQLASSQRSRVQSRHPSHGINSITPTIKDKGKGRAMIMDLSPLQRNFSQASRSLARTSSPHPPTPPLSPPNFSRDEDPFVPAAASTGPPQAKGLPRVDSRTSAPSHSSQFNIEEHLLHVDGMLDRDVDFVAWTKDVPITEEKLVGVPERVSQS
ncbi:hypothetical protein BJV78DRAFT_750108 [Lactifluus subvellereus]|nr:hypothetical protein BJV78DRAFT_750108 [Lactifluus subvellereus]